MLVTTGMAFGDTGEQFSGTSTHSTAVISSIQNDAIQLTGFNAKEVLENICKLSDHGKRKDLLLGLESKQFLALYSLYYTECMKKMGIGLSELDRNIGLAITQIAYMKGMRFADGGIKIPHQGGNGEDYWTRISILESTPSPDSLSPGVSSRSPSDRSMG